MKKRLLLIITVVCFSCTSNTFENKNQLWEYLKHPDNGYLFQKSINGYDFSIIYKPTDLLVDQELSSNVSEEEREKEINKLREKYKKYIYFTLSMSKGQKELLSVAPKNKQQFGGMVNQLAFGMGEKVHVFTAKKDTLPMIDYIYPRMYGMSVSTSMLFVYPRDQKYMRGEFLNLTIEDIGLFTGEIKFKIPIKKIKKEPKLQL